MTSTHELRILIEANSYFLFQILRYYLNLKVYESLDRNNSVIIQYTIKYEDRINNTIIRAYRSYPHIDLQLQLQHGNKEKRIFDKDPSDYEVTSILS
jgi:hypothetical protein